MAARSFQLFEEHGSSAGNYTLDVGFLLIFRTGGSHGKGFAGAGLAIGEDGDIVALDERGDALLHILKNAFLIDVFAKDAVEDEELPAIGGVDGDLLARSNFDARGLEALRDELVARVAILQWWTYANSCIRLVLERWFCRAKNQIDALSGLCTHPLSRLCASRRRTRASRPVCCSCSSCWRSVRGGSWRSRDAGERPAGSLEEWPLLPGRGRAVIDLCGRAQCRAVVSWAGS